MEKHVQIILNKFLKKLNKNADIKNNLDRNSKHYSEYEKCKYPYKPALVIAIIANIGDEKLLFNNDILIEEKIAKTYYDILTYSETFYGALEHLQTKKSWLNLGFNNATKNNVIFNIFDQPAYWLQDSNSNFWTMNKKTKTIRMNLEASIEDKIEFKNTLLSYAFKVLQKCIPDYEEYSLTEILDFDNEFIPIITAEALNELSADYEKKDRKYQHIFRKMVLDRDQKCIICCASTPSILEACHIKPYRICTNDVDRYSSQNGITLCKNHHKLFDSGLITFDNKWKLKVSNELLMNDDFNILIKTFESCYQQEYTKTPPKAEYLDYHHKKVFVNPLK